LANDVSKLYFIRATYERFVEVRMGSETGQVTARIRGYIHDTSTNIKQQITLFPELGFYLDCITFRVYAT